MKYISKSKFEAEMQRIKQENLCRQRLLTLKSEKNKYKKKISPPSTSKIVLLGAALLCLEIIIFCQYMIVRTGDTSALYAMIGVVSALAAVILGYFSKSKAENTKDGIKFESVMAEIQNKFQPDSDEAVG